VHLDPQWVVGFVDGEGCFYVGVNPQPSMSVGHQVLPEFVVVQHERDVKVLHALKAFFACGVVRRNHGDRWCLRVRGHENLKRSIVPFFERHELKTLKRQDFISFRRVIRLMEEGKHLTVEGLSEIRAVTDKMNTRKDAATIAEIAGPDQGPIDEGEHEADNQIQ
jgi:hypothetical protein